MIAIATVLLSLFWAFGLVLLSIAMGLVIVFVVGALSRILADRDKAGMLRNASS